MMLYAVLSDIHGNFVALEAVERDARRQAKCLGHDLHFISLGDVVDYGPQPNECMNWLCERDAIAIQGNHDRVVVNPSQDLHTINQKYWPITLWTSRVLDDVHKDTIRAWKPRLRKQPGLESFVLFHSSLVLGDARINDLRIAKQNLDKLNDKNPYGLFGHTHHQGFFARAPHEDKLIRGLVCPNDNVPQKVNGWQPIKVGEDLSLPGQWQPTIFNPGSVGQPRRHALLLGAGVPHDGRAAYALLHLNGNGEGRVQFRRVKYDVAKTIRLLRERVSWSAEDGNTKGHSIYKDVQASGSADHPSEKLSKTMTILIRTLQHG